MWKTFFFLISNKTFIEENWTSGSRWWTHWTMKQIQEDQKLKEIETKKSATAIQFVHPQIRAQRNKVWKSKHFKCSKFLTLSSKMRALRSCQTNHIKHAGTMFQMIERCFPNQFLHIKKKDFTDLGITHWIPNTAKTSHHKAWENLQWRRRWSTNSPSQQHKQHLLTKNWPFLIRLSMVSISSLAAIHKKKDTRLGTLVHCNVKDFTNRMMISLIAVLTRQVKEIYEWYLYKVIMIMKVVQIFK